MLVSMASNRSLSLSHFYDGQSYLLRNDLLLFVVKLCLDSVAIMCVRMYLAIHVELLHYKYSLPFFPCSSTEQSR